MTHDIHSCSYYCAKPECIKRQRDELRAKYVKLADSHNEPVRDFKDRLAEAIKQMPFGKDTTDSFAAFIRSFE